MDDANLRLRTYAWSTHLAKTLFFEPGERHYEVLANEPNLDSIQGLPEGAVLVSVEVVDQGTAILFTFSHPSFDALAEAEKPPVFSVGMRRLNGPA